MSPQQRARLSKGVGQSPARVAPGYQKDGHPAQMRAGIIGAIIVRQHIQRRIAARIVHSLTDA